MQADEQEIAALLHHCAASGTRAHALFAETLGVERAPHRPCSLARRLDPLHGALALLLHIETDLGIKISVDAVDIDDFRTIDGIARCVERQRSRR